MSTSVVSGGFELTSNHESGADMLEALAPREDSPAPRITVDKGEPVKQEDGAASAAAATLGKKGGEASAKARAEAKGKEAKPADPEPTPEQAAQAEKDKKAGNPRHDPSARVAESRREVKEAEDRAATAAAERDRKDEELRAERAERSRLADELARARAERERPNPTPAPQADPGKPLREHFQSDAEHMEALVDYKVAEREREAGRRREIQEREQIIASHKDGFKAKIDEAKAADPAFLEKTLPIASQLEATFNIPPHEQTAKNWMADYLVQHPEDAPALLLHLSETPSVFQRVASLRSPHAVYVDLAKIVARLEAAPTAISSTAEVSKARPPVRPVTGSPHTAAPDITGDIDFDTFMSRQGRAAPKR